MMKQVPTWTTLSVIALLLAMPALALAQTPEELAKQTQNPIASLISVPFQANWDFGLGTRKATGTLLNFQPVIPFAINKKTNVILRIIVPMTSQPDSNGLRVNGTSDVLATVFFSPSSPGKLIWGAGPVFLMPTATNNALGTEKFGVGPSAVALLQPGKWTLGVLFNHVWSTSGAIDRNDVNQTYLQPFVNYNLGSGLAAGVSVEATGNWEASQHWTTNMLFSLSKVTLLGKRPTSISVAAGPTVASPDGGSNWRFRLAMTFLFPK